MIKHFRVKPENFKRVLDNKTATIYTIVLPIAELPDFEGWGGVNPQGLDMTSSVVKDIQNTLENEPEDFAMRNRGLTISAKDISYNNKIPEMYFTFEDKKIHGLLDGNHTYEIAKNYHNSPIPKIRIEFIELKETDPNEYQEIIEEIAMARNLSHVSTHQ